MSDTPRPKRKFWQIHLASLVVGSLTIALVMMLFLGERSRWYKNQGGPGCFRRWGLPFIADVDFKFKDAPPASVIDELPWYEPVMALRCKPLRYMAMDGHPLGDNDPHNKVIFYFGTDGPHSNLIFCVDIALCLGFVGFITMLTEWFIRRREARKP